ncbi:MAG: glycine cleavage system aminomethyltransferase GcvT [Planctomycetaceae bacterium]|nr:glycine cleavage system aminomethyltransferase GcvT [Planctomycetaceae bacterium]
MHKTPLNAWHHANNGRMVDFAGWEMPVQYTSIVQEHAAVRSQVGVFDISHMGRLAFHGADAAGFLNHVLTNDTARLNVGDVRYSLVCHADGGILDDVLVYCLPEHWELVVNASNREKIVAWLQQQPGFVDSGFRDNTLQTGMIAVQGPEAVSLASELLSIDVGTLKYYTCVPMKFESQPALLSRTGYTGEDGCEIVVPAELTETLWLRLLAAGASRGIVPAGLGCRDTLRLEAAMPLYGHELDEQTDPITAGLLFGVKLNKDDFIGRDAIAAVKSAGPTKVRVGLELEGRRIAREHTPVELDGRVVGEVTSGTFSPTLQKTIAMAYVETELASNGTPLQVSLRGNLIPAVVVPLPFYRRAK